MEDCKTIYMLPGRFVSPRLVYIIVFIIITFNYYLLQWGINLSSVMVILSKSCLSAYSLASQKSHVFCPVSLSTVGGCYCARAQLISQHVDAG